MKFDNAGLVESIVWDMRQADLPRGENRAIIQQLFNGDPPFDPAKAEENNVEINRNDLEGVDLLAQGREQWNNAMLPPGNFFSVQLDSGPQIKREEWGTTITTVINEQLKKCRPYIELQRARGGNAILHGIGPCNWKDRRCPIANPIPVASLMIPSETEIDFENLEYHAVFREWTPSQLYRLTHGPRCDPGWNMPMVRAQLAYVANKLQKEPNATAYQYMPERIEELIKQDLGFWGSDAVPTIDVWDFYFREADDGKGWYRRIILDWGLDANASLAYGKANGKAPPREWTGNKDLDNKFLYTSGKRKWGNSINEIINCQFADNSCFFPQKYHSIRALGWMLWGICDLQNRLHCKFNEQVFLQLMWFFRVASDAEMRRLKSANFMHFGVIPPGVNFIPGDQRFKPDAGLINMAFARNLSLMSKFSGPHSQNFEKGDGTKEQGQLEVMAKLNQVNARVGGMLNLAYTYEEFHDREICRRLCIRNNPYPMAQAVMRGCLEKGVPEQMMDVDRWVIRRERVLGAGNQTLQMAIVDGIQKIRKNLGPEAQRKADHLYILYLTQRKDLADSMAPMDQPKLATESMHDAQLSTERLMMGLPFAESAHMIFEDYVKVWLIDLELLVQQQTQAGMATMDQIRGYANMAQHIGKFLGMMDQEDDRDRIAEYKQRLTKTMNLVRGLAQRLKQQMAAVTKNGQQGTGGIDAKTMAEIRGKMMIDRSKSLNLRESHAQRTAQRQTAFELEQQRKDRELNADLRRRGIETGHELATNTLKAFKE